MEVLEVDEAEDKVQLTTFKARLKSKEFVVAFAKSPPRSMAEMLLKAYKYMNTKDALAVIEQRDAGKERMSIREDQKGKRREKGDHSSSRDTVKKRDNKPLRMVKFTPLVMLVDNHALKWPKPLHSSPNVRDKKKY